MICKVLKLFVNALTARDKYSLRNREYLMKPIQMELSQKQETWSQFLFLHFWNLDKTLNVFQQKTTFIAHVFPKLRTTKNVIK